MTSWLRSFLSPRRQSLACSVRTPSDAVLLAAFPTGRVPVVAAAAFVVPFLLDPAATRSACLQLILFSTCPPLCAGALWRIPAWVWRDIRSGGFFFQGLACGSESASVKIFLCTCVAE